MEKEKIGITTVDWILSIAGILVLTCFIVLPPLFRVVLKEKPKAIDDNQPVVEHMTCTKSNYASDGYITTDVFEFTYINNRISNYSRNTDMTFSDLEAYEQQKQEHARLATMYSFVDGVDYENKVDDNNLKIKITEKVDLGKAVLPTTITIPGDTEETQVTTDYTRNDNVSDIKVDLKDSGYTCK